MSPFDEVASLVKLRSGIALGPDKVYLLDTRLAAITKRLGVRDYTGLIPHLRTDRALQDEIVEALTTNETLFFRDSKPFEHLRSQALPRLHETRPPGAPLRLWSAAALTGQEAYSLAMLVSEMGSALGTRKVEILGTDIARAPLARARAGLYSQFEVQRGLPSRLLVKYFTRDAEGWRLIRPIRDMAEFRIWNLLSNPAPLGRFDVVFCRNVMIYFDLPTKIRVLELIAGAMAPGGLLYLGGAETINGLGEHFRPLPGEHYVFEPAVPALGAAGRSLTLAQL